MLTAGKWRIPRIPRTVHGEVGPGGIPDVLHDVDFAGIGPATGSEGPERRPEASTGGEFDPRGCSSVCELELRLRPETPRNENERTALWGLDPGTAAGPNDQRAVF